MRIHGPSTDWREERAQHVAKRVDALLSEVATEVLDWYRSFDDINLTRALWLERVNVVLLPLVVDAYDTSIDITWRQLTDVDSPQRTITAAFIPKFSRDATSEFIINARRRLVAIGDMLWDAMRIGITAGLQFGENITQLKTRIRDAAATVTPRARNIATTEVIGAVNAASFNQVKVARVVALKRWVTEDDDRVRASHRAVDGTQIAADAKFIVGGFPMDYPHDPEAPPEQTMNCRCDLVWEIIEEGQLTDELVVQSLTADGAETFHLPGRHDQSTHGRRTSREPGRSTTPPQLNVVAQSAPGAVFASDEPWVFSRNPSERAAGLWASSFNGMDAVRQVMRNRAAGRADFADFKFSSRRFESTVLKIDGYTESDLRNDVLAAALNFEERLDNAPTTRTRLYRGMRFSDSNRLKVGDTFTQDVASWTEDRGWASVYANTEDQYHTGDVAVLMRLEGPHRSASIDSDLPSFMRGSREHVARGTYRVKSVTGPGKRTTIVVEEVAGEVE
jgi:hypothetical protein